MLGACRMNADRGGVLLRMQLGFSQGREQNGNPAREIIRLVIFGVLPK
jgi:hypothetical protein